MNVVRRCCRPGCPHYAVATLTFVYSDSTAVIGPLATAREPHSWDLCVGHAGRITAPRGWELVRHAGPLPEHPDEDDLVALADAVREGTGGSAAPPFTHTPMHTSHHPAGSRLPSHGAGHTAGAVAGRGPRGFSEPAGAPGAAHARGGAEGPSSRVGAVHRPAPVGRRRGHLRVLPDPTD